MRGQPHGQGLHLTAERRHLGGRARSAASVGGVAALAGSPAGDSAAVSPLSSRKKLAREPASTPRTAIPVIIMATAGRPGS
jgi:hypothetical protein